MLEILTFKVNPGLRELPGSPLHCAELELASSPIAHRPSSAGSGLAPEPQLPIVLAATCQVGTVLSLPAAIIYFSSKHRVSGLLESKFPVSGK